MNSNEIVLKVDGVSKAFGGVQALKNMHLELRKGEVHGLVGENGAGKSTLMKILLGVYKKDSGTVIYDGREVNFRSPREALDSGIVMVHQEINTIMEMDVSENLWFGREGRFQNGPLIDVKKRREATAEVLQQLNLKIDPSEKAKNLSIAQLQLIEIARAVSCDAKIVIMDEPTSALTDVEVNELYRIIEDLIKQNKAVVFISHKLEEVLRICDRITILRDGEFIDCQETKDVTRDMLISSIVGRAVTTLYERTPPKFGDTVLKVSNYNSTGVFSNINFELKAGEVLGFAGLMGAGRTEIARALFGIDPHTSGELWIDNKKVTIRSPKSAVIHGMGMVTEDRLRSGCVYTMSIIGNATLAVFPKICNRLGLFKKQNEESTFEKIVHISNIKYGQKNDKIGSLSGGNQQKVVIGRWLITEPKILILDEPTRGIDVGAKAEIYKLIDELSAKGIAVILISSELPEIFSLCDRIAVIRGGEMAAVLKTSETDSEEVMHYCFGT